MTINLLEPRYTLLFRFAGVILLIMTALAYGEFKAHYGYIDGRFDQCLEQEGYLVLNEAKEYYCMDDIEISARGMVLDKETKSLVRQPIIIKDIDNKLNLTWNTS